MRKILFNLVAHSIWAYRIRYAPLEYRTIDYIISQPLVHKVSHIFTRKRNLWTTISIMCHNKKKNKICICINSFNLINWSSWTQKRLVQFFSFFSPKYSFSSLCIELCTIGAPAECVPSRLLFLFHLPFIVIKSAFLWEYVSGMALHSNRVLCSSLFLLLLLLLSTIKRLLPARQQFQIRIFWVNFIWIFILWFYISLCFVVVVFALSLDIGPRSSDATSKIVPVIFFSSWAFGFIFLMNTTTTILYKWMKFNPIYRAKRENQFEFSNRPQKCNVKNSTKDISDEILQNWSPRSTAWNHQEQRLHI